MRIINLREHYPQYQTDYLLEVADEIALCLHEYKRKEHSFQKRRQRYKAYYSLDRCDGIEKDILFVPLTPQKIYERKLIHQELNAAISSLPDKQAKRIYAYFFLGMSLCDIARTECVTRCAVQESIKRGLRNIRLFLSH